MRDQSFQVLPGCYHHSFDVHFEQTPQPKTPQTVKFLRLSKKGLNPHAPFAHGLQIGFCLSVGLRFVEIRLKKRTENMPPTFAASAMAL